jgi:hypothetical protein
VADAATVGIRGEPLCAIPQRSEDVLLDRITGQLLNQSGVVFVKDAKNLGDLRSDGFRGGFGMQPSEVG